METNFGNFWGFLDFLFLLWLRHWTYEAICHNFFNFSFVAYEVLSVNDCGLRLTRYYYKLRRYLQDFVFFIKWGENNKIHPFGLWRSTIGCRTSKATHIISIKIKMSFSSNVRVTRSDNIAVDMFIINARNSCWRRYNMVTYIRIVTTDHFSIRYLIA